MPLQRNSIECLDKSRNNKLTIERIPKEEILEEEEIDDSAEVIVPPDGGWAWVVMVASFLCNTVVDGIVLSSGMIQKSLIADFQVSEGYVALVSSLLSGFYLMAGPFVSALANRYGFRPVTVVGAIFAAASFGLSYYATSVEFLFISYGFLGGIGFCMVYIPSVITIGYYFEKWRALATGIAMCGSGVGTFIFAPLTSHLAKEYGWRNTMGIQALIILSCALYGAAFRPIQPIQLAIAEEDSDKNQENGNVAEKPRLLTITQKPLPEGRFAYSVPNSAHNTYMGATPKHHYPTASEIFRGANFERRLSGTPGKGTELKNLRKSQPTTPNGESHPVYNLNKELTTVGENEEEAEGQNLLETEIKPVSMQARRHTVSGRRPIDMHKKSNTPHHETHHNTRPMYRDDIFFSGSLVRIPQYTSQSSLGYHMSVTRLPTKRDILEERQKGCQLCPEAVRRTLATMLDTSLLKSPSFMLLAISGFLTMMGFFVPFIFVVRRALMAGMDEHKALFIVSAIGITNTFARIGCGLLSSFDGISPLYLNNIAITAGGLATIFSGHLINDTTQFIFAAIFGICIACFSALRSVIAVELMGLEKLTNAFGFLMLFQGLAAAMGAPIAGVLFDLTGSYDVSFYFAGSLITLSAFLCYPLNYVNKWEKERDEKQGVQQQA
ncbi:uncharacterized protein LOC129906263 [Episyrphus balteatus]|uniref:uncharacterized protein LOC129906263 n=1 Tax=Episyrphus balteatus TaxID=286459 RepID=UPI00248668BD|nr:uncharacterized protein LOC129906263 [Episyrphus balteatus]